MPQLHLYVPDEIAERIQHEAKTANLSISRYLAELVEQRLPTEWPASYFEDVYGAWQGEPLIREAQGTFEERERFGTF